MNRAVRIAGELPLELHGPAKEERSRGKCKKDMNAGEGNGKKTGKKE